jgi:hypothetical protein
MQVVVDFFLESKNIIKVGSLISSVNRTVKLLQAVFLI